MAYDNVALEAKKREIANIADLAESLFGHSGSATAQTVVDAFVRMTPPTKEEVRFHLMTLDSRGTGGNSRKPGNVFLNWRKLFEIVPDITIAAAGAPIGPVWLQFAIALYIWNKLWRATKEEFGEPEATVIYTLWKNRNSQQRVEEASVHDLVNQHRRDAGLNPLSQGDCDAAINRLLSMECIEVQNGMIWLHEWVRISY